LPSRKCCDCRRGGSPSLGLSPKIVEEVFAKVHQVGKSGVTVLIVEQNVVDGLSISDRGYVVENGEITLQGTPKSCSATSRFGWRI